MAGVVTRYAFPGETNMLYSELAKQLAGKGYNIVGCYANTNHLNDKTAPVIFRWHSIMDASLVVLVGTDAVGNPHEVQGVYREDLQFPGLDFNQPEQVPLTLTALADRFEEAGYATAEVEPASLKLLGIDKVPKTFTDKAGRRRTIEGDWESFCTFVYERLTGKEHPGCSMRGRGFRSQAFGRDVAKAIREKVGAGMTAAV